MKLTDKQRNILEKNGFNTRCQEELETWTSGSVNMFVFFTEEHKNLIEAFEDYLKSFDIDEEIELYRQDQGYRNNFTTRESLEDFEEYLETLKEVLEELQNH